MLRRIFTAACLLAVVAAGASRSGDLVAKDGDKAKPTAVAYVNIAEVLKKFEFAADAGQQITKSRQTYVAEVTTIRQQMAQASARLQAATDPQEKIVLQQQAVDFQRKIEDIDRGAQKALKEQTDGTILDIYRKVKEAAEDLAKDEGFDVVEIYPSAPAEGPAASTVAQLTLQTSVFMPIYVRPEFDKTADFIARLNRKFPVKSGK